VASHRPIRFYLDYISSNAYLAWTQIPALAARLGRDVEPVPVLFAGLLEAHGQLGPAEVIPKARWMWRNNLRKAALLGVPLSPPAFHPFNPLLALRVSSLDLDGEARARLVTGLFGATWARGLHVAEPAVVAAVADEAGLDGAALVAAAQDPEAKARLRRQTDDAIAAGVFGVPTVVVGGELFWGFDDLPWVERFLAGEDPLDPEAAPRWEGPVRPAAMRRRHRERVSPRVARARLCARDPEGLARWWARALGLEQRGCSVEGPGTRIAFEPGAAGAGANTRLGFEVGSREEVMARARQLGVAPVLGDRSASARIEDPEGNSLEVFWQRSGPQREAEGPG
jgi:2-hydroxychromene-2-carboxylate isomerase